MVVLVDAAREAVRANGGVSPIGSLLFEGRLMGRLTAIFITARQPPLVWLFLPFRGQNDEGPQRQIPNPEGEDGICAFSSEDEYKSHTEGPSLACSERFSSIFLHELKRGKEGRQEGEAPLRDGPDRAAPCTFKGSRAGSARAREGRRRKGRRDVPANNRRGSELKRFLGYTRPLPLLLSAFFTAFSRLSTRRGAKRASFSD